MNYIRHASVPDTPIATLVTGEQSARRMADVFAEALFAHDVAVSRVETGPGKWRVTIYFGGEVAERTVRQLASAAAGAEAGRELRFERIAAKDWVAESLAGLRPIAVGRFVVHGAHDRGRTPPNRIGLEIEAALAFGTGHHGTTRGCLLALDRLCRSAKARRILDLGTGTGVLAIAAAHGLHRPVLATDIDAKAARIARDNARLNRTGSLIRVCRANGLAAPAIRADAPFDLIFANILLEPLQRLASPLGKLLAPRGRLVLSGVLKAQANAARAAYRTLTLEQRIEVDGWTTLILKRGAAVARNKSGS
jgi:ribosomal protein L11 methyltransferase